MSGAPISLDSIAVRISGDDKHFHQQNVADLLNRNQLGFPGAQPVSFSRQHLIELQNVDYFMCEKTDGIRCLMFLTEINYNGQPTEAQFLIDRKNDYYYIPYESLHIPHQADLGGYHRGTILDGELVRQTLPGGRGSRLAYLIFDLLAIDGENVTAKPFDKRLSRVENFISKPLRELARRYPQDVAAQPFQVEMKQMEFPYGMEMMFKDKIPKLPHGNDGLIFTSREDRYTFGTDQKILKWKPPHENTIDFRLLLGAFPTLEDDDGEFEDWDAQPDMELHVSHGDRNYQFFAMLTLRPAEWEALKRLQQQIDGRIIECYRDPDLKGDVWRPKLDGGVPRFRDDKKDANHISTVNSVLESIQDAVTEEDLIAEAGKIRTAYKARIKARQEAEEQRAKQEAAERKARQEAEKARQEAEERNTDGPTYTDD